MKEFLRHTGILMFAFLALFSTTGVVLYNHICGCPVPTAIVAQTSHPAHTCCEAQETPEPTSGCCDGGHDQCSSENHKGCHDAVTYLKAPIISIVPIQEKVISEVSFEIPDFRIPDAGLFSEAGDDASPYIDDYLIPPRSGRYLVILHQSIKIPSPEDLS